MATRSNIAQVNGETSSRGAAAALRFPAARLSMYGTVLVFLLLVLLHFVKPELDPSWRFISEYSIGQHGWIMMLAFLVWSLACAALFLALKDEIPSRLGRIGNYLLLVVAVSLVFAGLFPQDPVTAKPEELTSHGKIHAIASIVGIPGIPIAAMLIGFSLVRHNPAWAPYRIQVIWLAHLTWISLLVMAFYLAWAVPRAGGFNSEVWAGWMNRIVVATYLMWQAMIAWRIQRPRRIVDRLSSPTPPPSDRAHPATHRPGN